MTVPFLFAFLNSLTRRIIDFNKWKFYEIPKTLPRNCAQYIQNSINKCNNDHTWYTCKQSLGMQQEGHKPSFLGGVVCRLCNKQTIYRLLHPSPGAEIHGASHPLPSNGRLCISQKSSATPTPPVHPPDTRYSRCNQRSLRTTINRFTFQTTWKLLTFLNNLPRIILIYWFLVYLTIRYELHFRWQNDDWCTLKTWNLQGQELFLFSGAHPACYSVSTWVLSQSKAAGAWSWEFTSI